MGELRGILWAYPHIGIQLYYADASLYGPWKLSRSTDVPVPVGGGGTDFRPFFEALEERQIGPFDEQAHLAVYLTDGFGCFPDTEPDVPMLWLAPTGSFGDFPWGDVARLEVA